MPRRREKDSEHQLTPRQWIFFQELKRRGFNPGAMREVARDSGYSDKTPMTEILKPMNSLIKASMRRVGLTADYYAEKLKEGLECNKDGEPDNANRLKALAMALEIEDAIPDKKIRIDEERTSLNVDIQTLEVLERRTGERLIPSGEIVDAEVVEASAERNVDGDRRESHDQA